MFVYQITIIKSFLIFYTALNILNVKVWMIYHHVHRLWPLRDEELGKYNLNYEKSDSKPNMYKILSRLEELGGFKYTFLFNIILGKICININTEWF